MRVLVIAGRELKALFLSPIAYVVLALYFGIMGLIWWLITSQTFPAEYRLFAHEMHVFILFFIPAISMRAIADERRTRTLELLVTQPVRDWEIVLGKWLACVGLLALMLVGTMQFWGLMHLWTEGALDDLPVLTAYLGLLLAGMLYVAIGVFCSAITENQLIAALVTFTIIIGLYFVRILGASGTGFWQDVFQQVSTTYHFDEFARGVLDTGHVVYFLLGTFVFLFMSVRTLESRSLG